jgi:hypothetical protein
VNPGAVVLVAGCPLLAPAPGGEGTSSVAPLPAEAARAANNEGKALYRAGKWAAARARYAAARQADPQWMAPALNAACALARQERFAEAASEAAALARLAFVPWGREVREAADLAPLHVRPEMRIVEGALAESALAWGRSVMDGLFFVARTRPAVGLAGEGVLVLGLQQELFAWLPHTGRYRQITSDDGRVLAAVRSPDGRTVVYVRAGKLVRPAGARPVLRGLTVRRLDVPTMTLGPPVEVPGDVEELALWPVRAAAAELRVSPAGGPPQVYHLDVALVPQGRTSPEARLARPVVLTPDGVSAGEQAGPATCAYRARDERSAGQPPRVRITVGKKSVLLEAPHGAGLHGLPFPR